MKSLGRSGVLTGHIERSGQRAVDLVQSGPSDQVLSAASSDRSTESNESRPARPGSAWVAAGLAFLLCWCTIIGLDLALRHHDFRADFAGINGLLVGCAGIVAALLGTLIIAQCRLTQDRGCDFAMGVGFLLYGSVVLFMGDRYPPGGHTTPVILACVPPAALLLVLILIGRGTIANAVASDGGSRRFGPLVLIALGVGALAMFTVVLYLVRPVAGALAEASSSVPGASGGAVAQLALAAWWLAVVILLIRRRAYGARRPRQFAVAIAALGLIQARVAVAISPAPQSIWVLGSHLFQLIGFAVALPMMAIEFDRRVISQHRQLFNSLVAAGTDSARCRAHESIDAAYAHDLRSALFLLDGAARTLVDRLDDLSSNDRTEFGRLIGSGVERLSTLVCELAAEVNECELHNVVRSVVKAEKNSGVACSFDLPTGIRCAARPADVAGILHTLIRTVWTDSRPATVAVTGKHEGGRIALTIGPAGLSGQPADRRSGWLHPSAGQAAAKDAVELQVAARLLNEQGGTISTATDDQGRTSFEITLSGAQPALRLLEGAR